MQHLLPAHALSWIVGGCLVAAAATPLFAHDWYVDVNDPNCPSGTGSATAPFCRIQTAIDAAAGGDTIHIGTGTYLENLAVAKDLVLIGTLGAASTIVDGAQTGSVVTIDAGFVVTLSGLKLTHGLAAAGGGVLIQAGADVTIDHCILEENTARVDLGDLATGEARGGGVAADHATLSLIGTTIQDNEALVNVNGYDSTGSALGGGAWISGGVLHLVDTHLARNEASAGGTGFDYDSFARGGGLFASGSDLDGSGSSITGSVVKALLDYHSLGSRRADGAGVYAKDCTGEWAHVDVSVNLINYGVSELGGGLYIEGGSFRFDRCSIHGNLRAEFGGGIYVGQDAGITLDDCGVDENSGGGIFVFTGASLSMTGGSVSSNSTVRGAALSLSTGAAAQVFATRFEHNKLYSQFNWGGAISNEGTLFLDSCSIIVGTEYDAWKGGAIYSSGTLTMKRCVVSHGKADYGGALYNRGHAELTDTALVQNSSYEGGGAYNSGSGELVLNGCTIAGNSGTFGGGVYAESTSTLRARHSVFSGNSALRGADLFGTLNSEGFDLITDTSDCTIVGDETGNQYLVDPLFVNPSSGDFSLQASSPAVDAGDPAEAPAGADAAAHPRWLDGNLDRRRILDLGAYEFDCVQLAVTGDPTPGGALTFDLTGTSELYSFLIFGLAESELDWPPFGALFVDLSSTWRLFPIGLLPGSLSGTVPSPTPDDTLFVVQCLAVSLANGAGNLSNVERVTIHSP